MKMAEFLALSDDEKVDLMPDDKPCNEITEDRGACVYCGKYVDACHFCFGCHLLVCDDCVDKDIHHCVSGK